MAKKTLTDSEIARRMRHLVIPDIRLSAAKRERVVDAPLQAWPSMVKLWTKAAKIAGISRNSLVRNAATKAARHIIANEQKYVRERERMKKNRK